MCLKQVFNICVWDICWTYVVPFPVYVTILSVTSRYRPDMTWNVLKGTLNTIFKTNRFATKYPTKILAEATCTNNRISTHHMMQKKYEYRNNESQNHMLQRKWTKDEYGDIFNIKAYFFLLNSLCRVHTDQPWGYLICHGTFGDEQKSTFNLFFYQNWYILYIAKTGSHRATVTRLGTHVAFGGIRFTTCHATVHSGS